MQRRHEGSRLTTPVDVRESAGQGIAGTVEGRLVSVGSAAWNSTGGHLGGDRIGSVARLAAAPGQARVVVGVDGVTEGVFDVPTTCGPAPRRSPPTSPTRA